MDDLISRQAALDAIRNITEVYINNLPTLIDKASVQTELMMLPSEHPELDEWCDDCKEYDQERHCCPRFSRVIKAALEESERIQKVINVTLDEEKVARVVEHRKKMQERKKGKENENTVYMQ